MWENTTPSTELPRDFCARIGTLQLGVVLDDFHDRLTRSHEIKKIVKNKKGG